MAEQFNPKQFNSYEELPDEQKPNFKKVENGFIYKEALPKEEAEIKATMMNWEKNKWDKRERREARSSLNEIKKIHPEGLKGFVYAPTVEELKECKKAGNVILTENLPVVCVSEFAEDGHRIVKENLVSLDIWHDKKCLGIGRRMHREDLEVLKKCIEKLEASLQKSYNNYDSLFDNIRNKKIIELAAGQSVASTFPSQAGSYQSQPTISRVLAYCSNKLGLNAEVTAVDLGVDPIIESRYGVKGLREYFENLPYILEEKDKPDIVIMNYWHPHTGAIPKLFKPDTVFVWLRSDWEEESEIKDAVKKGFKSEPGADDFGAIFWKDPSYKLSEQETKLQNAKKRLYNESRKGIFPTYIGSLSRGDLDALDEWNNNHSDKYEIKIIEIDKLGKEKSFYDLKNLAQDESFILVKEDNWPGIRGDYYKDISPEPKLFHCDKSLPLFFDAGHTGFNGNPWPDNPSIYSKKSSLYKINLKTEETEKIIEVVFPERISHGWVRSKK